MPRTVVTSDELPAATVHHSWMHPDDLPDLQVRPGIVDALDRRNHAAQALESAIVYAYLIAATRDEAREAVASVNLIAAREAHDAAEIALRLVWPGSVGGSLPKRRPHLEVVESLGPRAQALRESLRCSPRPTFSEEVGHSVIDFASQRRAMAIKRRRHRKAP